MRISTITNLAYVVTVVLTALSGSAFLLAARAAETERVAVKQHLAFDVMAEDLALGVEKLTDEARLYAVRGEVRHRDAYVHEAAVIQTLDKAIARVRQEGASPAELAAVADAERNLGDLTRIESGAVAAADKGDGQGATRQLFGPEHERAEASVVGALDHFRALVTARTETEMRLAQERNDDASLFAKIMLGLTALLFLSVLYFVLRRRVALPLSRMSGILMRLAKQDYAVVIPPHRRRDEIGEMTQAIAVFRDNGRERDRLELERQADQRVKDNILQMTHRLQACETRAELAEVVTCFAPQTFPDLAGRLYVLDEDGAVLTETGRWLDPQQSGIEFPASACWGLRRGRPHMSHGEHQDVACSHIADPQVKSLCVPLTAQGDTIGLIYFEERPGVVEPQEAQRAYIELLADNVSLALANLRLRDRLAKLAVSDGLTGLLNRRSLDETLNRHALQVGDRLACIMIDIDHFKRFNDTFGHDAGDAVMQHVAQIMLETVGGDGLAYRFGGEEFTILLPGLDEAAALACAEHLRNHIREAPLAHHGRMLGTISISLGVAVSPDDGPPATLLRRADAALLQAKAQGRDRAVTASNIAAIADRAVAVKGYAVGKPLSSR